MLPRKHGRCEWVLISNLLSEAVGQQGSEELAILDLPVRGLLVILSCEFGMGEYIYMSMRDSSYVSTF